MFDTIRVRCFSQWAGQPPRIGFRWWRQTRVAKDSIDQNMACSSKEQSIMIPSSTCHWGHHHTIWGRINGELLPYNWTETSALICVLVWLFSTFNNCFLKNDCVADAESQALVARVMMLPTTNRDGMNMLQRPLRFHFTQGIVRPHMIRLCLVLCVRDMLSEQCSGLLGPSVDIPTHLSLSKNIPTHSSLSTKIPTHTRPTMTTNGPFALWICSRYTKWHDDFVAAANTPAVLKFE